METKSRRLVRLDSSRVSGLQSCHAVGLLACDRTYGDLLSLQRLVSETKPPLDEEELMARTRERRGLAAGRDDKTTDRDAESPRRESGINGNGMHLVFAALSRVSDASTSLRCNLDTRSSAFYPTSSTSASESLLPQSCVI